MIGLYILAIVLANVLTAMFPPITVFNLIIPCGSFLVAVTFFLRDFIQQRVGRANIYKLIILSAVISSLISLGLGDTWNIAVASVISFFVSEAFDTEIFTRLNCSFEKRVIISGLIGGTLDSAIFVVLALSPIGSGVLSWESVQYAVLGQTVVKCIMQFTMLPLVHKFK